MKLTNNEKQLLKMLIDNADTTNRQIADKLNITTQGVGKLKKNLESKGLLKKKHFQLNYDKSTYSFSFSS
jgi:DNA-binding Lrp family transcriptional regulator